jgi:hypothetical protein
MLPTLFPAELSVGLDAAMNIFPPYESYVVKSPS